jgi:transposase
MQVTTIRLDIAKNVFQVHGIDAAEKVVVRKQLRRSQMLTFFKALPPCLIGMEACATAHFWARELTKLGHTVRLMPARDVKAYVKRNKNDSADAEAICEAVRRPTVRSVQVKSAEQQSQLTLHRTRDLLMRQRTQVINALRAHLAEFGITAAQGTAGLKELLKIIAKDEDEPLPVDAHASLVVLAAELITVSGTDRPLWLCRDGRDAGRREHHGVSYFGCRDRIGLRDLSVCCRRSDIRSREVSGPQGSVDEGTRAWRGWPTSARPEQAGRARPAGAADGGISGCF